MPLRSKCLVGILAIFLLKYKKIYNKFYKKNDTTQGRANFWLVDASGLGMKSFTTEVVFETGFKRWAEKQAEGGSILPVAAISRTKGRKKGHKKHSARVVWLPWAGPVE